MIKPATPLRSSSCSGKLNIVILYDERHMFTSTTEEHVAAFRRYSRHNIYFVPATRNLVRPDLNTEENDVSLQVDISIFDVAIVHYAVRLALPDHLNEGFAEQLANFKGLKLLFIQDEYDTTERARQWMERLQFDIVYTCVPEEGRHYVYPPERFPNTEFLPTLTGYVPEDLHLEDYIMPIESRRTFIGYRGRELPFFYGQMGYEKYQIGAEVKKRALEKRIPVDIEVDDRKRIYGTSWYRFLGSVRGMLGSESGSNVFDFDGSIRQAVRKKLLEDPDASFEEIHRAIVAPHDGKVRMNQISPKIFEAIRLRTALILFEGFYSGVVQAETHYIPLKKDFSNLDEVFAKLGDVAYLKELTDRAYRDIIEGGRYSYRSFIGGIDTDIEARVTQGPRYEIFNIPVAVRAPDSALRLTIPTTGLGYCLNTGILGEAMQREEFCELIDRRFFVPPPLPAEPPSPLPSFDTYLQQKRDETSSQSPAVPVLTLRLDLGRMIQYLRIRLVWAYLYCIRTPVIWACWLVIWFYWHGIRAPVTWLIRQLVSFYSVIRRAMTGMLRPIYHRWGKPLMRYFYRQARTGNRNVFYYLLRPVYRLLPISIQGGLVRRVDI